MIMRRGITTRNYTKGSGDTDKKLPFELNEAMLRELEAERQGAQMVAKAEARMIISLFESNLRPGGSAFEAVLLTVRQLENVTKGKIPLSVVAAASGFLAAGCHGNEASVQHHYAELLEQLMEYHLEGKQASRFRPRGQFNMKAAGWETRGRNSGCVDSHALRLAVKCMRRLRDSHALAGPLSAAASSRADVRRSAPACPSCRASSPGRCRFCGSSNLFTEHLARKLTETQASSP
jgi:hypothetical protein